MRRRCVTDKLVDEPRSRLSLWSLLVIRKSKFLCEAGRNGALIPMRRKRSKLSFLEKTGITNGYPTTHR
jgi:hypothetical protein